MAKLPVCVRDFSFLDSMQVHGDQPSAMAASIHAAAANAKNFDAYVGRYALSTELILEVLKIEEYLFIKFPGYPPG